MIRALARNSRCHFKQTRPSIHIARNRQENLAAVRLQQQTWSIWIRNQSANYHITCEAAQQHQKIHHFVASARFVPVMGRPSELRVACQMIRESLDGCLLNVYRINRGDLHDGVCVPLPNRFVGGSWKCRSSCYRFEQH
jgi:hypothetical protein